MNCFRLPCGQQEIQSKTKLKNGTIGFDDLDRTLEDEKPGYGGWMPTVSDRIRDIIEEIVEEIKDKVSDGGEGRNIRSIANDTHPDRITQLRLRFMEHCLVKPKKNLALSSDKMSLLLSKKNTISGDKNYRPTQYALDLIQEVRHLKVDEKIFIKAQKSAYATPESSVVIRFKDSANVPPIVFLASTPEKANSWILTLKGTIEYFNKLDYNKRHLCWLWEQFKHADKDNSGILQEDEIKQFFVSINLPLTLDLNMGYKAFSKSYANNQEGLDWGQLKALYGEMLIPEKISYLFHNTYDTSGDGEISIAELRHFLEMQKEEFVVIDDTKLAVESDLDMQKVIDKYGDSSGVQKDGFTQFLRDHCLILNGDVQKLYQDMTYPMTDYFIASSHNTYLKGDQINGTCTIDAYVDAIENGCRCVELDCWDDGGLDEPVIYHGWTPTKNTRILFKEVCKAITETAFKKTTEYDGTYPFIISIENHCNLENQTKMAAYLVQYFGEKIITAQEYAAETRMPSPEDLRDRVIIKGKKLKNEGDDADGEVSEDDEAHEHKENRELSDTKQEPLARQNSQRRPSLNDKLRSSIKSRKTKKVY